MSPTLTISYLSLKIITDSLCKLSPLGTSSWTFKIFFSREKYKKNVNNWSSDHPLRLPTDLFVS